MTRASTPLPNSLESDTAAGPRPAAMRPRSLERPSETQPIRIAWGHAIGIGSLHLLALLALVPWFFSWTGVALVVAGILSFHWFGINVGYHRLLTHRGFACPKWLERVFALLGVCCLEDSPARWVAIHRMHHQHSDEQPDPHTPLADFFWAHMGWLLVRHRRHSQYLHYEHYARDLLRDPFYVRLETSLLWLWVYIGHALLFFVVGLAIAWPLTGSYWEGVQFGMSLLVWGVFVRTVVAWHNTWWVNSVTHIWGYRNYDTNDNSRNNWLVALLCHGEGWHNNHHADQRSAKHGHKWWEFDTSWLAIRAMERVGLAWDVVRPRDQRTRDQ